MIDLRRLRVLQAVAHYGTVTAAAEALHFTPSAASQQIRALARELDVALLEQHGRRVRLTPAAKRLLAHADAIQARWEEARADLYDEDEEPAGTLRVSSFPVAIATLLAPVVATLRARYPQLCVQVLETELQTSFDLLFSREVDLAVVEATPNTPPPGDSQFDQVPLLDDPFDLVVSDDHAFASEKKVELVQAAEEEWVVPLEGTSCHVHTTSACSAAGFTPRIGHHARDWNASASLVAHGSGSRSSPGWPGCRPTCR